MRDGVGDIRVRGRSKDLEARQILQTELNDEHHDVIPGLMTVDQRQDSRYPIVFTTIIQTDSYMAIDWHAPACVSFSSIPPLTASFTPDPC